jgi:hypothetical protein
MPLGKARIMKLFNKTIDALCRHAILPPLRVGRAFFVLCACVLAKSLNINLGVSPMILDD